MAERAAFTQRAEQPAPGIKRVLFFIRGHAVLAADKAQLLAAAAAALGGVQNDCGQLALARGGEMVVIFHRVARTQKMAAPIVEEERQVIECDQMQCAAQRPRFDGGGAQDILIRRFPAAETQRVQAVAVKLRL